MENTMHYSIKNRQQGTEQDFEYVSKCNLETIRQLFQMARKEEISGYMLVALCKGEIYLLSMIYWRGKPYYKADLYPEANAAEGGFLKTEDDFIRKVKEIGQNDEYIIIEEMLPQNSHQPREQIATQEVAEFPVTTNSLLNETKIRRTDPAYQRHAIHKYNLRSSQLLFSPGVIAVIILSLVLVYALRGIIRAFYPGDEETADYIYIFIIILIVAINIAFVAWHVRSRGLYFQDGQLVSHRPFHKPEVYSVSDVARIDFSENQYLIHLRSGKQIAINFKGAADEDSKAKEVLRDIKALADI